MLARITALYIELVFRRPLLVIALVLITAAGFGYYTQYFRLDASADSLMLEGDKDLEYSREINAIYGISESVIIAYTPLNAPLFSRATLERMESLRQELLKIDRVSGVDSILNVPIFLDTPLTGISEDYLTLNDAEIDLEVAREELVNSPVFRNAVVSPDGETAGMLVSFEIDQRGRGLVDQRTELRSKEAGGAITAKESQVLADIEAEYARYTITTSERQTAAIAQIRSILINYRSDAQIFLGGAPMIADDLVTFVRDDLSSFSFGVLGFIIVALGLIFRKVRWVVLPLVCCAVAGFKKVVQF